MFNLQLSNHEKDVPARVRLPRAAWVIPLMVFGALAMIGLAVLYGETQNSKLEAIWLSYFGSKIKFEMAPGPDPTFRVSVAGPYNQRLGYSYIPFFVKTLGTYDYQVAAQMRTSSTYDHFLGLGLYPIYHAKTVAGFSFYDRNGDLMYEADYPRRVFADFQSIPPLLVHTLLFIENRELLSKGVATRNPAIEWDRFFYAAFGRITHIFSRSSTPGGGSTLATQIEKFRYSPGGQTRGVGDKLRQVASATARVYLDGPDTTKAREKIVLDYLNSTPFSARAGFGEVNSIGDGLWAWFGMDLNDVIRALNLPETDPVSVDAKARAYRAVLGLILSQRRPSHYLQSNSKALHSLTNATLDRLAAEHVISPALRDATKNAPLLFLPTIPKQEEAPLIEQKGLTTFRTHLMQMLGLHKLYEMDRLDLSVRSTLDKKAQEGTVDFLKKMATRDFLQSIGLYGYHLLKPDSDPSKIRWSVILFERGADGNRIRVQADNLNEPLDMNEGVKLDLGSTAKLRTIITYLEIIDELHRRYAGLDPDALADMADQAPDPLSAWVIEWLSQHPDGTLDEILKAAMDRKYSAYTGEIFFTDGGTHRFSNFEASDNGRVIDLHEAFRKSVNLVFVRLMRDILNYTIAQGAHTRQELMASVNQPARQGYIARFADQEGGLLLSRFINEYSNLSDDQILAKLIKRGNKSAVARTLIFRIARPTDGFAAYTRFMADHPSREALDRYHLIKLYKEYPPTRYTLSDLGYVTGIHPLELWLVAYLHARPTATRRMIMEASHPVRIESYAWIFHPRHKRAQDTRIRMILEQDAFGYIQKRWARLGYPFDSLVPSLATALGTSADKPEALAELVGIILNDGIYKPTLRFDNLQFGENTPYQTLLVHNAQLEQHRVLPVEIARIVKSVMAETVQDGTARRVKDVYKDADGKILQVGGKTGTEDQRLDRFGRGGVVLESRVVNRTATFTFYIGDKFFGTITAHVKGDDAAHYVFTSALCAQVLKALAPTFEPLITGGKEMPKEKGNKPTNDNVTPDEPTEGSETEVDQP